MDPRMPSTEEWHEAMAALGRAANAIRFAGWPMSGEEMMRDNKGGGMEQKGRDSAAMTKAQKAIGAALAELERETEGFVRGVDIVDHEVTTYSDSTRQLRRAVVIDLERKPGTSWEE